MIGRVTVSGPAADHGPLVAWVETHDTACHPSGLTGCVVSSTP
jgi:hypothetical protein